MSGAKFPIERKARPLKQVFDEFRRKKGEVQRPGVGALAHLLYFGGIGLCAFPAYPATHRGEAYHRAATHVSPDPLRSSAVASFTAMPQGPCRFCGWALPSRATIRARAGSGWSFPGLLAEPPSPLPRLSPCNINALR